MKNKIVSFLKKKFERKLKPAIIIASEKISDFDIFKSEFDIFKLNINKQLKSILNRQNLLGKKQQDYGNFEGVVNNFSHIMSKQEKRVDILTTAYNDCCEEIRTKNSLISNISNLKKDAELTLEIAKRAHERFELALREIRGTREIQGNAIDAIGQKFSDLDLRLHQLEEKIMANEIDSRGYLESRARPSEVKPRMKQNDAALEPVEVPKQYPVGYLNNKMKGEC